jgi:hypothetical protein
MTRFDDATRARARALRDAILSEVEDRTDPRYVALIAEIAAESAALSRAPVAAPVAAAPVWASGPAQASGKHVEPHDWPPPRGVRPVQAWAGVRPSQPE